MNNKENNSINHQFTMDDLIGEALGGKPQEQIEEQTQEQIEEENKLKDKLDITGLLLEDTIQIHVEELVEDEQPQIQPNQSQIQPNQSEQPTTETNNLNDFGDLDDLDLELDDITADDLVGLDLEDLNGLDLGDLGDLGDFSLTEEDLQEMNRIKNPSTPIRMGCISKNINGKDYKFYFFDKTENFIEQYKYNIYNNKNTVAFLFPDFENIYNKAFLEKEFKNGNITLFEASEFTDEMYNSVSEDYEYLMVKNLLQILAKEGGFNI